MADIKYDLIVIGSGPAGEKGASQVAYFGKKVAIIEKAEQLGGSTANIGALPSKVLRETSLMLSNFKERELYDLEINHGKMEDLEAFLHESNHVVQIEQERVKTNIERHGIDVFYGEASFLNKNTIKVLQNDGQELTFKADKFLLATGASPKIPELFSRNHPKIYNANNILSMKRLPKSLAIVGAGVRGCEYACIFAGLGVKVTLINADEYLLDFIDNDISLRLKSRMLRHGIRIHDPERVVDCKSEVGKMNLTLESGKSIQVEAILVTVGRIAKTESLNLPVAGVELAKDGYIKVNADYQTTEKNIYAAGDVIGFPALPAISMEQARIAMVNAFGCGYKSTVKIAQPYAIFTIPEISYVGKTEEELNEEGVDYIVGKAVFGQNNRGVIIGDKTGMLKLLFKIDDMELLGVHVIGENATEIVHTGMIAMMCGKASEIFMQACFNYPSLSELYKYATYDAMSHKKQRES